MNDNYIVYNKDFVLEKYLFYSNGGKKKRFVINADVFGDFSKNYVKHFVLKNIRFFLNSLSESDFLVDYQHRNQTILIAEVTKQMKEVTLLFPYDYYDKYYKAIKEINDLVSEDGMVEVFANNMIYTLEAGLCIHTSENYEEVLEIANKYNMEIDYSKGLNEIIEGIGERQYNSVALSPKKSLFEIQAILKFIFVHKSRTYLETQGFQSTKFTKKKIFVSYCHKNKEIVRKIIDELRGRGLDFWIDEEQIDYGERLMERIDEGVRESDLPIVFLSKATQESMFAKHELFTFFTRIIYQNDSSKNWFIVKLDDVNPNDIVMGLGDFKYFDFETQDVIELVDSLKRKLN